MAKCCGIIFLFFSSPYRYATNSYIDIITKLSFVYASNSIRRIICAIAISVCMFAESKMPIEKLANDRSDGKNDFLSGSNGFCSPHAHAPNATVAACAFGAFLCICSLSETRLHNIWIM